MSIKTKLVALFLSFAILPVFVLGGALFSNARTSLMDVRISQLEDIADLKKDKIEAFFNERRADIAEAQNFQDIRSDLPLLVGLADQRSSPVYRKIKKELDGQIKPFQEGYGYLDVMLADRDGKIVYVSSDLHVASHLGSKLPKGKTYDEIREQVYFTDVFKGKIGGTHYEMYAMAPVRDLRGMPVGQIIIEIDMAPIYKFIQNATGLGETGEALIVRKEGDMVLFLSPLRNDPDAALQKTVGLQEKRAFPAQKAARGENGAGIANDYNGEEVLAAWRYIPSLGWGLVTKINAAEAFSSVASLKRRTVVAEVIILILGALIASFTARSISGPIRVLQKGAEIIGRGDLDYRVATNAKDEIGHLSRAFDRMTVELGIRIDDYKKAEEEIRRINEELERRIQELALANREMESFSYSVSHDLRSPLRSIDGFSQALLEDYNEALDEKGKDYLQRVRAATQRMGHLIDGLLNLSRLSRAEMVREKVDMTVLAGKIVDELSRRASSRSAEFIIADGLIDYGDSRLLSVVLQNLLGNAWKFTEKKSAARIEFGINKGECPPVYFVRDDGAGFDMAYVDKLFSPFQRLHSVEDFEGTGIGLATVHRIIQRHGGRIWVESEIGKGTTFYFTLNA